VSVSAAEALPEQPPWRDWGGSGPPLHFAHANGFPPATYRALIEALCGGFHVQSMAARPLWGQAPPTDLADWSLFAEDLRDTLERRGLRGIIGAGHSLGGVTSLLAAADDPGLFSAVVAIDPLVLTGLHSVIWGAMKKLGLGDRLSLVRGALRRRAHWPDRRTIREAYRQRKVFRDWQPAVLEHYLESGFVADSGGGLELRYPRDWEAAIFRAAPHNVWPKLRQITVPVLFIQGAHSDTFTDAARLRVKKEMPDARVVVVPGAGHFVAMEKPTEVGKIMMDFLDSL
jgi:pimeloyl-ACP methyl ester carboxylesterase